MSHATRVLARSADGPGSPDPTSVRELLGQTSWFAQVPGSILDRLARQSLLHRVPAGSLLFEQSETPAFAQFLVGGSVELLGVRGKDETLIEVVRPVDVLLPAAVLSRQPYLMGARVLEEASLAIVPADEFRRAVAADHALCLAVLACQAAQFRRQVKHAKNIRLRSAEERVACYLLRLVRETPPGEHARLPLEKRLIASHLGMTRETFSRSLAVLARHGLRVEGDTIHADDLAAASTRFALDPLIDGAEVVTPLPLP